MKYEDDVMEIDLLELLLAIRDKIAVILATAVICAGLAGVYSFFIAQPVYQSTSKLYIQAQSSSAVSLSELQVSSTLAHDCVEMIRSGITGFADAGGVHMDQVAGSEGSAEIPFGDESGRYENYQYYHRRPRSAADHRDRQRVRGGIPGTDLGSHEDRQAADLGESDRTGETDQTVQTEKCHDGIFGGRRAGRSGGGHSVPAE